VTLVERSCRHVNVDHRPRSLTLRLASGGELAFSTGEAGSMAQWVAALEAVIPVARPSSAEEAAGRGSGAGRAMEASAPPLAPEFLQRLREVHGAVQVRD